MQDSCNMLRPSWYHDAYIRYCGKHPVGWLSKCLLQGQAGVISAVQVTVETWYFCAAHRRTLVRRLCVTEDLNADGGVCMQCAKSNMGSSRH